MEHPHGAHPWDDPFEAIYPAGEALPERNLAMNQIAPVAAQAAPLPEITVAGIGIRQDGQGRYCLNDLHRASGTEARHKPGNWLMLDQTKALAAEIEIAGIPAILSKQGLGTFVCRELVYAYAMWISPAFHLKVIRAYDAMATQAGQPAFNIPQTLPDALRLAADLAEQKAQEAQKRIAAETALAEAAPKAQALERIAQAQGSLCITDAAKALQVTPQTLFRLLQAEQWIYRRPGGAGWLGYQNRIQSGLLEHKVTTVTRDDGSEKVVEQCRITPKGLARLASSLKPITPRPPIQ